MDIRYLGYSKTIESIRQVVKVQRFLAQFKIILALKHRIKKAGERNCRNQNGDLADKFSSCREKRFNNFAFRFSDIVYYPIKKPAYITQKQNQYKKQLGKEKSKEQAQHPFVKRRHPLCCTEAT